MAAEPRGVVRVHRAPLGEGAADGAPTAPHATPRSEPATRKLRSGPERFWSPRRLATALALAGSLALHALVSPWSFVPHGLDVTDVEGEATLDIDLLDDRGAEAEKPPTKSDPTLAGDVSGPVASRDGGADSASLATVDASSPPDAGVDATGDAADAADAAPQSAPVSSPPEMTPQGMIGADVRAEGSQMELLVNMEVIRANAIGVELGPALKSIPQWEQFMAGSAMDPVRDTDWMIVSGPSMSDTRKDVIVIRYGATDANVDDAIQKAARRAGHDAGDFDAGVPNVSGTVAEVDKSKRVFLRPQPHVVAVAPIEVAAKIAKQLAKAHVRPHMPPAEAFRMKLGAPSQMIAQLPPELKSLRVWVRPLADGADAFAEGECASEADARVAVDKLNKLLKGFTDNVFVSFLAGPMLQRLEIRAEGKLVKVHFTPTRGQLRTILGWVKGAIEDARRAAGAGAR